MPEWRIGHQQHKTITPASLPAGTFAREFDAKLEGKTSKLVDYSPNAPRVMAEALPRLLAKRIRNAATPSHPTPAQSARTLSPSRPLNVGVHAPHHARACQTLLHLAKKISHHRRQSRTSHRMSGSRPLLT